VTGVAVEELRGLFLFEGLTHQQLSWLAERGQSRTYDAGAPVYREGEPSAHLYVLLDGGLRMSRLVGGEDVVIIESTHRGSYSGAVRAYVGDAAEPYGNSVVTTVPSRFFQLPAADFAELMHTFFPMAVHLLDGLFIGVRNSEATIRQREHLAQLGTLSANLAHELNNPAAAAVRATGQLRQRVAGMRRKLARIAEGGVDPGTIHRLVELQEQAVEHAASRPLSLTPVEEADREDEITHLLDRFGVPGSYDLAPVFTAAGLDVEWLQEVCAQGDPTGPLRWLADTLETEGLMDEIEDATGRISTLVAAVKQYSYVDTTSHQEVDVHVGLESTVVMLGSKLQGVRVDRDYDLSLPKVPAYGAELNQVWTNLIDNAADAMGGTGTLRLRTTRDGGAVLVEIGDDGPGVPLEVQPRMFDAFFTTKAPGQGSGLGLDNAHRIVVRRHGGTLDFVTGDSGTTFRVRLPLVRPQAGTS
jgi:signal transduction histidine kinase